MSILDKKHILTINLDDSSIEYSNKIKFYNTDKNISNLYVKIKKTNNDGVSVDLTETDLAGLTLKLAAIKPKTNQFREITGVLTKELKEYTCAIYKFDLPVEFTNQVGPVYGEFELTDELENGESMTIDPFSYVIKASKLTGLNAEIESNPDLPVLKQLIKEVKEIAQTVNNIDNTNVSDIKTYSNKKIEEKFTDVDSQIKDKANLTELEVERKRIDSFVRLENGSTTGDAELMDIRIGADSNEYVTAGQAVREQIKPYVKYVGVNSENLFDYINATDGYYNSLDGTLNTTSGYKTTGLIPYKIGDVIRKSKDVSWFVQWIGFFDINGNILISDIGIDDYVDRSNSSYDEFCLSEKPQNGSLDNLAYITIAVSNFGETNDFANYMIVKNIDYPSSYVPYGFNYSNNFTNKILEEIEKNVVTPPIQIPSILDNKTLLFSGDSIMQALIENGDGTYGESYGWAELLKESNPLAIVKNYGQGGTTIAKRSDRTDSILERIDKMHTENPNADYIIFEGGVNDCYSNVPLGEITSDYNSLFDESTFCGALESLLKQAIVKWKGKKICYIVTFKVPTADYANFSEYMKKAKEICEKWSIPYIDLYTQSGMEYHIEEIATAYSYGGGGLHPNIEGYKLTIPKIAEFIKSL